ncbi:MAG: cbb3-type cytochrome c oxidase subunit 3 [Myxococcota bacterium]
MRLSDIMGNADLAIWPSIGLILFLSIFAVVVVMTFSRKRSAQYKEASQIPLDDYIPVHERGDDNE